MNYSSSSSCCERTSVIHEKSFWKSGREMMGTVQKNRRRNGVFHRFMGVNAVKPYALPSMFGILHLGGRWDCGLLPTLRPLLTRSTIYGSPATEVNARKYGPSDPGFGVRESLGRFGVREHPSPDGGV